MIWKSLYISTGIIPQDDEENVYTFQQRYYLKWWKKVLYIGTGIIPKHD